MKDETIYITEANHWNEFISKTIQNYNFLFKKIFRETGKFPVFDIKFSFANKSNRQLRTYWRLVTIYMHFFNETGQCDHPLDKEQTSDMLLIECGLYEAVRGNKIAKSLKASGSITKDDMRGLLQYIVDMGDRMEIDGLTITTLETSELLKYYSK